MAEFDNDPQSGVPLRNGVPTGPAGVAIEARATLLSNHLKAAADAHPIGAITGLAAALADKQAAAAKLSAIAGAATAADKIIYFTGAESVATGDLTAFARGLLDDGDAATARATLGLGTAAVANTGTASGAVPLLGTGGLVPAARLGTGTADATTTLHGDGTYKAPAGGSTGTLSAVLTAGASAGSQTPTDLSGLRFTNAQVDISNSGTAGTLTGIRIFAGSTYGAGGAIQFYADTHTAFPGHFYLDGRRVLLRTAASGTGFATRVTVEDDRVTVHNPLRAVAEIETNNGGVRYTALGAAPTDGMATVWYDTETGTLKYTSPAGTTTTIGAA